MSSLSDWPQAKSRHVDLDGQQVHYLDFEGPAGAQMLLCVHGLGGSALNFGAVGPRLAGSYRVVAVDLYGHGRSTAGDPGAGGAETVRALVRQIAQFAESLSDEPVVLVGHSLGGVLSVLHTLQAPTAVDRLVLLDPPVPHQTRLPLDMKLMAKLALLRAPGVRGLVARQALRSSPEALVRRQLADATPHASRIAPEAVAASVAETHLRAARPDARTAQRVQWNAILGTIGILVRAHEWRDRLGDIRQPTLWLQGEDDLMVPPDDAEAFAGGRATWTYLAHAGVGHLPHLEDPQWTSDTVENWLRENP
jgi:pimeloyl-ACP methyl ester carboxylesterase